MYLHCVFLLCEDCVQGEQCGRCELVPLGGGGGYSLTHLCKGLDRVTKHPGRPRTDPVLALNVPHLKKHLSLGQIRIVVNLKIDHNITSLVF